MEFEAVIGLEVHVQLATRSKLFCGCATAFGSPPNAQTCPVCLGFPGVLPVLNREALRLAIKVGVALGCKIQNCIKFDRKNYFYPDLPKNYQISQFAMPIGVGGKLRFKSSFSPEGGGRDKEARIRRVHLEEDAGKLLHPEGKRYSLVDFNRTGIPLLEIVSEPNIHSAHEALDYLVYLKLLLEYLEVSDCDMEKGSLRVDANISIRKAGETTLGVKTELKNLNSFKAVRDSLAYEAVRQANIVKEGGRIKQETRLWDDKKAVTLAMRSKEEAHDYRYFPEPDLVPFVISEDQIQQIRQKLPEYPLARMERFMEKFGLPEPVAVLLTGTATVATLFEQTVDMCDAKSLSNWIIGPLLGEIKAQGLNIKALDERVPQHLASLVKLVDSGKVNNLAAKEILAEMLTTGKSPEEILKEKDLAQISSQDSLEPIATEVISEHPKSVQDYLAGKENALMFLVGQMMKKTKGKANPKVAQEILKRRLYEAR